MFGIYIKASCPALSIIVSLFVCFCKRAIDTWSLGGCSKHFLWRSAIWSPGGAMNISLYYLQVTRLSIEVEYLAQTHIILHVPNCFTSIFWCPAGTRYIVGFGLVEMYVIIYYILMSLGLLIM